MGEGSLRWHRADRADAMAPEGIAADPSLLPDEGSWIDPSVLTPDRDLVARLPPAFLVEHGLLPWRRDSNAVVVLCAFPRRSTSHLPRLRAALGTEVRLARTEPGLLARTLHEVAGRPLALRAEAFCPAGASCRTLSRAWCLGWAGTMGVGLLMAALCWPSSVVAALAALAILVLVLSTALRLAAALASARRPSPLRRTHRSCRRSFP